MNSLKIKKYKQINKMIAIVFILFVIISTVLCVHAGDQPYYKCGAPGCPEEGHPSNNVCIAYHKLLNEDIFANNEGDKLSLSDIIAFDINNEDTFKKLWDNAEVLYGKVSYMGYILVMVYFLVDLMQKVTENKFTAEYLAKAFIKLFGAFFIIINGWEIITLVTSFATIAFNAVNSGINGVQEPVCTFEDLNALSSIGRYFVYLMPWVCMWAAKVVIRVMVWTRVLKIIVYVVFAPIGMADMISGLDSSGFMYLKKIALYLLQGATICAIMAAYRTVSATVIAAGIDTSVTLVLAWVVTTLILRSERITGEIVGI